MSSIWEIFGFLLLLSGGAIGYTYWNRYKQPTPVPASSVPVARVKELLEQMRKQNFVDIREKNHSN
jgi:hypothetical protein